MTHSPQLAMDLASTLGAAPDLQEIELRTSDFVRLAVDLHLPRAPLRGAVLLAPAMGVPRRFYRPFARALAEGGLATLALDYRGMAGSAPPAGLPGFLCDLGDWAHRDLEAGLGLLRSRFSGAPLAFVGHSIGGQLFGLLQAGAVQRALLVGAQNTSERHWSGLPRAGIGLLWRALLPALVGRAGYLPMRLVTRGDDVPAGVARHWARWGLHPRGVESEADRLPACHFRAFTGALRVVAVTDDRMAPVRAVEALAADFKATRAQVQRVDPRALGMRRLGHFAPFRPVARERLWLEWRRFLAGETA